MGALHYQSLAEFVEGTKGMTRDETFQSAKAEYAILSDWIDATPAAQKYHRPADVERFVDYFADLQMLLHHLEFRTSTATGYKHQLILKALKQWDQSAKRVTLGDGDSHK